MAPFALTLITEVETIKRQNSAKVRDHWLWLRPRLYAGSACDDRAAEAAYAAVWRYIHVNERCLYLYLLDY